MIKIAYSKEHRLYKLDVYFKFGKLEGIFLAFPFDKKDKFFFFDRYYL